MNSCSNIEQLSVLLTKHACKRARERYHWNPYTLERMAKRAFDSGLKRSNTAGYLKIYLDKKFEKYDNANLRLYGENVFVFVQNRLVTVWHLPLELRPLAKVCWLKFDKSASIVKANCSFALPFLVSRFKEIFGSFSEEINQTVSIVFDNCATFCA